MISASNLHKPKLSYPEMKQAQLVKSTNEKQELITVIWVQNFTIERMIENEMQ